MGQQKLLLPWNGRPVIRQIVSQVVASQVSRTIVVSGGDHEALARSLEGVVITLTRNPLPKAGMLASLRVGLKSVSPDDHGFLVVLGDQPSLTTRLLDRLLKCWRAEPQSIWRPQFQSAHGHPVVIPMEFRQAVMTEFDQLGLKGLLRRYPDRVRNWRVDDPGVVVDIDTPEDYERELARVTARYPSEPDGPAQRGGEGRG